jgi:hypothetical protein
VVDVKVLLVLVVNVNLELRDVVLGLGGDDEIVGREDLELLTLELGLVLRWAEALCKGSARSPPRGARPSTTGRTSLKVT